MTQTAEEHPHIRILLEDAEIKEFSEDAVEQANRLDLEGAVGLLKQIEVFEEEADYYKQLTWAAFTHVHDFFGGKYDLCFVGPKSSGKTRCTVYSTLLARNGFFVTDTTPASLTELLDGNYVLGFDEADSLLEAHKNDLIESILRSSSAEESQRVLKEHTGKGWELRFQSLGAPKVYNFHDKVEDALLSRALPINVRPHQEKGLVNRRMYYHRWLDPVIIWLRREVDRARARWDSEKVEELVLSPGFINKVASLPSSLPRYSEQGLLMFATAEIMGWELGDLVRDSVKGLEAWDDTEPACRLQVAGCRANRPQISSVPSPATRRREFGKWLAFPGSEFFSWSELVCC